MTKDETVPQDSVPKEVDVASVEGDEKVSTVAEAGNSDVVNKINETLGRNYKDIDSALKGIKETYDYVGKPKVEGKTDETSSTVDGDERFTKMEEDLFYLRNKEYEPYKAVIRKMGGNPAEVVGSDEFQTLYEKAKGYDESQSVKSVLHSNPRLGVVKDKMTSAREKLSAADKAGDSITQQRIVDEASKDAVSAVLEAFEL